MLVPELSQRGYPHRMDSPLPRIDTTLVDQGPFQAHGRLEVWLEADLLCYRAAGPFNVEMVEVLGRALQRLDPLPPARYASLVWWQHSMLASPDTLAAYEALLKRRQHRPDLSPPVASLWLAGPDVEGARLMRPRWAAVYAAAGWPLEFCDTDAQMRTRARALLSAAAPGPEI